MKHLEIVKQYQSKNYDQYKKSSLKAVHKYQVVNQEKYKESHLKASQKYQAENYEQYRASNSEAVQNHRVKSVNQFPPSPPSTKLQHTIISEFCKDTTSTKFTETGCAVCGQLTSMSDLKKLDDVNLNLDILIQPGVTQKM